MRFQLFILFLCAFPLHFYGQLFAISDHYAYNSLAINPAFAGSQGALSTTLTHRRFLSGFEGSPTGMSLSMHAPIDNERVGLGFLILNDKIGISKETSFIGNYAFRMELGYGNLAFGLGFSLTVKNSAWDDLAANDTDDVLLGYNSSTGIIPDFSFGTYYSTKEYFIGISAPLFLSHEYEPRNDAYKIRPNFSESNIFAVAGYYFQLDGDIKISPSVLVKYHQASATQIDISTQVILKDKVWLGISYRSKRVLVSMVQYQINDQLRVAYSYDFLIGHDLQYMFNSQEIMLHYLLNYKSQIVGPRNY